MLCADLERGTEAFIAMGWRQPDVDDRDIGRVATHLEQEIISVATLRDHIEARVA